MDSKKPHLQPCRVASKTTKADDSGTSSLLTPLLPPKKIVTRTDGQGATKQRIKFSLGTFAGNETLNLSTPIPIPMAYFCKPLTKRSRYQKTKLFMASFFGSITNNNFLILKLIDIPSKDNSMSNNNRNGITRSSSQKRRSVTSG